MQSGCLTSCFVALPSDESISAFEDRVPMFARRWRGSRRAANSGFVGLTNDDVDRLHRLALRVLLLSKRALAPAIGPGQPLAQSKLSPGIS